LPRSRTKGGTATGNPQTCVPAEASENLGNQLTLSGTKANQITCARKLQTFVALRYSMNQRGIPGWVGLHETAFAKAVTDPSPRVQRNALS
jgi:hypothetical protein